MVHFVAGHFGRNDAWAKVEKAAWRPGDLRKVRGAHVAKRGSCESHSPMRINLVSEMKHMAYRTPTLRLLATDIKTMPVADGRPFRHLSVYVGELNNYVFAPPS